jgi:hypothetical protein
MLTKSQKYNINHKIKSKIIFETIYETNIQLNKINIIPIIN